MAEVVEEGVDDEGGGFFAEGEGVGGKQVEGAAEAFDVFEVVEVVGCCEAHAYSFEGGFEEPVVGGGGGVLPVGEVGEHGLDLVDGVFQVGQGGRSEGYQLVGEELNESGRAGVQYPECLIGGVQAGDGGVRGWW